MEKDLAILRIKSPVLYQLSYPPVEVGGTGFEPVTSRLTLGFRTSG